MSLRDMGDRCPFGTGAAMRTLQSIPQYRHRRSPEMPKGPDSKATKSANEVRHADRRRCLRMGPAIRAAGRFQPDGPPERQPAATITCPTDERLYLVPLLRASSASISSLNCSNLITPPCLMP